MKILALEFSSSQRSVAVVQGEPGAPPAALSEVVETGAEATQALGMVDEALREARLEREQIECLALGLGPGSYTGIRAAIALAQGWQLATGVKLLGLGSVEALAAQAQAEGLTGPVCLVIDAQRNEFYIAGYELSATDRRQTEPLRLATLKEVQQHQQAGARILGPDLGRWFPEAQPLFPRAAVLGQLAMGRTNFVAGEKLEPIYLRQTTFVKAVVGRPGGRGNGRC